MCATAATPNSSQQFSISQAAGLPQARADPYISHDTSGGLESHTFGAQSDPQPNSPTKPHTARPQIASVRLRESNFRVILQGGPNSKVAHGSWSCRPEALAAKSCLNPCAHEEIVYFFHEGLGLLAMLFLPHQLGTRGTEEHHFPKESLCNSSCNSCHCKHLLHMPNNSQL